MPYKDEEYGKAQRRNHYREKRIADGHVLRKAQTTEERKEYLREWWQRIKGKRTAWFAANGPCVKCGSWKRLELDHIDPKTKKHRNDHAVWSWSEERRQLELTKCQVLCHDCHQEKTIASKIRLVHGTLNMYQRHGCRCAECKKVSSVAGEKYRQNQKLLKQQGIVA